MSMASRGKLRRKMVLPVTVIRRQSGEKQLAHTLDVTENTARLGGLNMLLTPGEVVEIQRGARKARFHVYWMGAKGTELEGQAGVCGVDPGKTIWSVHLPTDEADIAVDTFHVRGSKPSRNKAHAAPRPQERIPCRSGATLRAPGSNYPVRVQIREIHLRGLFVESTTTFPVNTVVSLETQIEGVAIEATGSIMASAARVGMEIAFHRISGETQRKIVQALQKLKDRPREEEENDMVQSVAPARPESGGSGAGPANCISAARMLVAICKTLSGDFDFWRSTRSADEIEELRQAVAELQQKLSPAGEAEIQEFLSAQIPKSRRPV